MLNTPIELDIQNPNCKECNGLLIQNDHEYVCESCGLIYNDLQFTSNYQFNEIKDTDMNNPDQFVSVGKVVDNVCTLGSHIGYYSNRIFYDYKGALLSSENQKIYSKLKKFYALSLKIKNHETDYRILKILNDVSQYINLSMSVKNRAAYLYQKIKKETNSIRNHVSLIAFCIFHTIKEYSLKAPISIRELSAIFCQMGHRINPRLIIRDSLDYQSIIKSNRKPHQCEDYIIRLTNAVANYSKISDRMIRKKSNWSREEYKSKLISCCDRILHIINLKNRGSRNPFILAGAIVYCADKLIARENGVKSILTQSMASEAMGIAEYSIRDHYVKILKPIFDNY